MMWKVGNKNGTKAWDMKLITFIKRWRDAYIFQSHVCNSRGQSIELAGDINIIFWLKIITWIIYAVRASVRHEPCAHASVSLTSLRHSVASPLILIFLNSRLRSGVSAHQCRRRHRRRWRHCFFLWRHLHEQPVACSICVAGPRRRSIPQLHDVNGKRTVYVIRQRGCRESGGMAGDRDSVLRHAGQPSDHGHQHAIVHLQLSSEELDVKCEFVTIY